MKGILLSVIFIVVLAMPPALIAGVPGLINYQGRLADASGNPVPDGQYLIKFKIYGSQAGDDSIWSNGSRKVQVINGLFNYLLGDSVPLPNDLFSSDTTRFLGIKVGTNSRLGGNKYTLL